MNTAEKNDALHGGRYKVVNGVTYFKLKSEYDGDYTKNCGLLGEEIDQNFYFLRGYDIESVSLSDDNKHLIVTSVNGDTETLEFADEVRPVFEFDKTTGVLTVTYPCEEPTEIKGFLVEGAQTRVVSDGSLKGNGTIAKPLGISEVELTGTYAPAAKYFDITVDNKMPNPNGKGYRVVTKETINPFGLLYSFDDVLKIDAAVSADTAGRWRVPTKKDWDELLNALEPCKEDRNHCSPMRGYYGKKAGIALKSVNGWSTAAGKTPGENIVNFTAYPVGSVAPNSHFNPVDDKLEAKGTTFETTFWTKTHSPSMGFYTKTFAYNLGGVAQDVSNTNAKLSLRLVRDIELDHPNQKIETILGVPYPCEVIEIKDNDNDVRYCKVWTAVNVGFNGFSGSTSYQWECGYYPEISKIYQDGKQVVYFINEWNGSEWVKKIMRNGDSVVIGSYIKEEGKKEELKYHEWRIVDGVLIDAADATSGDIKEALEKEIEERKAADITEAKERMEEDARLEELIYSVVSGQSEDFMKAIEEEREERMGADSAETIARIENDIKDGTYQLSWESGVTLVHQTVLEGEEPSTAVTITINDNFFDFGTI